MDSNGCIARSRIHLETPETPSYLSVHYYLLHSYAQHLHNFGIKIVFTEIGNVSIDQITLDVRQRNLFHIQFKMGLIWSIIVWTIPDVDKLSILFVGFRF